METTLKNAVAELESVKRLTKDLRKAAETMGPAEIRYLVDGFYSIQEYRKASRNQVRAAQDGGEPGEIIEYIADQAEMLERQIKSALDGWSIHQTVGKWMRSNYSIGPVITSGMIAHFDITKAPTAGHFWSFAGLDPKTKWFSRKDADAMVTEILSGGSRKTITEQHIAEAARRIRRPVKSIEKASRNKEGNITAVSFAAGIAKRPWNADLKVLCWKLGSSFVRSYDMCICGHWNKVHEDATCTPPKKKDRPQTECNCAIFERKSFYGKLYLERKAKEVGGNEAGKFADQASRTLQEKKIKATDTLKYYKEGKLPPGRIDLRARRWVVKLFLSHLHTVMYFVKYEKLPPVPFAFAKADHAHYIAPPNLEGLPDLAAAIQEQYPSN